MASEATDNDLLIEDIDPDLLRRIEESARSSGRTVEEEVIVLMTRGLALQRQEATD